MEKVQEYKKLLAEKLDKYEKLNELEQQTGVEKTYIFLLFLVALSSILYLIGGATLIVNLVGFIYPAYMSFKAIGTKQTEDDTQWLTYWVVFAVFNITEQATDLFMTWIPFYFLIKVAFLVWCYYPATLGANVIYHSVIKPNLCKHMSGIDCALKKGEKAVKDAVGKAN